MIPILFAPGTTNFTTNGLGRLTEATKCIVKEQLNGIYELELSYPITGQLFSSIVHSAIIYALNYDGGSPQGFRIYEITKPYKGVIEVYAEHISYQTNWIPINSFEASSLADCFTKLKNNAAETNPFTFWTDKDVKSPISFLYPKPLRNMLGGEEGSVLQAYKGEYEWDNYNIKLWNKRGTNNGVVLRYGKNIKTIEQDENIENTYTGVYPYYYDQDVGILVTLPEKVIHSDKSGNFPYQRTAVVDFSDKFDTAPTAAELRKVGSQYISDNNVGHPNVSIKVDFVQLWQAVNYNYIAPLERVKLGDTVTVIFENLGIEEQSEVIEYEFDVLKERYNSVQIGDPKSTLSQTLVDIVSEIEIAKQESKDYVNRATAWLTRGDGYLYIVRGEDGTWRELIAMDTPNLKTAKHVLRLNQYGIGFSDQGVDGPYYQAWTLDGQLSLGGLNNAFGKLQLLDPKGNQVGVFTNNGISFSTGGVDSNFNGYGVDIGSDDAGINYGVSGTNIRSRGARTVTIDDNGFRIYNNRDGSSNNQIIADYGVSGISFYDPNGRSYNNNKLLATYNWDGINLYEQGKVVGQFNASGVTLYEGNYKVADFTASGVGFYNRGKTLAKYGTDGIYFYNNSGKVIAKYSTDGIYFYNNSGKVIAKYSTDGSTIYSGDNPVAVFDANGLRMYDRGNIVSDFNKDGIKLYYRGNQIADYGTSGLIINDTSSNTELARFDSTGLTLKDKNGNIVEKLSDGVVQMNGWYRGHTVDGGVYWVKKTIFDIDSEGLYTGAFNIVDSQEGHSAQDPKFYLNIDTNGIEMYTKKSNKETSFNVTQEGMEITTNGNLIASFTTSGVELNKYNSSGIQNGSMKFDVTGITIDDGAANKYYTEIGYGQINVQEGDQSLTISKDSIDANNESGTAGFHIESDGLTIIRNGLTYVSIDSDGIYVLNSKGDRSAITPNKVVVKNNDGEDSGTLELIGGIKGEDFENWSYDPVYKMKFTGGILTYFEEE